MTSKKFVLIGHPVAHSVSPAIHHAAYRGLGVSHDYSVLDCPTRADVEALVERLRKGEVTGVNVTVPWKRLAFELSDAQHVSARDTGVANVLSLDAEGRVVAANTDAIALAEELQALVDRSFGGEPGKSAPVPAAALIIGAGGAAQAAVVACRSLNIPQIYVCRRSWREDVPSADWDRAEVFEQLGATPCAWAPSKAIAEAAQRAEIVVQATSAGMEGAGRGEDVSDWVPWASLPRNAVAYDVVYNPPSTPFLRAAQSAGLHAQGGLGMLVRQAAAAVRIWLDDTPPFEPLLAAAQQALAERDRA